MEFPVIIRIPDAAPLGLIGFPHTTVVGLLRLAGPELLVRVAYPLDPPVLTRGGNGFHVLVELGAEHVVEVRLAQLRVVNKVTGLLNGEAAGITGRQPLRPFRLHFHQVPGRGQAQDHFAKRGGKLAELAEVFSPEILALNVTEAAVPGRGDQVAIPIVRLQRQVAHELERLAFAAMDENHRRAEAGFLLGHRPGDITVDGFWLPSERLRRLIPSREQPFLAPAQAGRRDVVGYDAQIAGRHQMLARRAFEQFIGDAAGAVAKIENARAGSVTTNHLSRPANRSGRCRQRQLLIRRIPLAPRDEPCPRPRENPSPAPEDLKSPA